MPDLRVGNDTVVDIKVGATQINAVYVGTTLVWSSVPNIDFPNAWDTAAVDDVWDFDDSESGAEITRTSGYVRLITNNDTLPYGVARMSLNAATAAEITPNTSYRLVIRYDRQAVRSPVGVTIGNVAAGTLSESDNSSGLSYLYEATFTTDSGASTGIEIFCDAALGDLHHIDVTSVELERA